MNKLSIGTVVFESVSKRYRLGGLGTLRGTMAALSPRRRDGDHPRDLWALRDVSFRVEPGESLGLIGPNGAGKTTALKLLSNITQPTLGRVQVSGRMSSLIELGAGFHPELTGRDNIFLNGTILGLKRQEIQRRLDAIIAFSELERFIDTPVKRYSSGMYVRLGFAVAAHVEPAIMLVDEVLAVGDTRFRQRCMQHMKELQKKGTTLVFVSHNMLQVKRLCDRVLLLWQGQMCHDGDPDSSIAAYELMVQERPSQESAVNGGSEGDHVLISDVAILDGEELALEELQHGTSLTIRARCIAPFPIIYPVIRVRLLADDNSVVAMFATPHAKESAETVWGLDGYGEIKVTIPSLEVVSGYYSFEFRILDPSDSELLASGYTNQFYVRSHGLAHEVDRGTYLPRVLWHLPGNRGADQ